MMLNENTFDTGEVCLNYAEGSGIGPPLVMLSGFTGRWQTFSSLVPTVEQRWHLYAFDHRGHGKSGRTRAGYRAKDYVADTLAFLEQQCSEPAVLLGSSMGGSVALSVAALASTQVRAIICLDPIIDHESYVAWHCNEDTTEMWVNERRLAGLPLEELDQLVPPDRAKELSCLDPRTLDYHARGRLDEFFAGLPALERGRIECPVLLVQGNPDLGAILTDREVSIARTDIPLLTHVRLEDRGHEVGLENDAQWVSAMMDFLESV